MESLHCLAISKIKLVSTDHYKSVVLRKNPMVDESVDESVSNIGISAVLKGFDDWRMGFATENLSLLSDFVGWFGNRGDTPPNGEIVAKIREIFGLVGVR